MSEDGGAASPSPAAIEALRLKLAIAEAERDKAIAEAEAARANGPPSSPRETDPEANRLYLLPNEFPEAVSADLFPRDGVGRLGRVRPLRIADDLAAQEYARRKSSHALFLYRRARTVGAYLELVELSLTDLHRDASRLAAEVRPAAGEEPEAWEGRVRPLLARRTEQLERTLGTASGCLRRINEVVDYQFVKGVPDYAVPKEKKEAVEKLLYNAER